MNIVFLSLIDKFKDIIDDLKKHVHEKLNWQ